MRTGGIGDLVDQLFVAATEAEVMVEKVGTNETLIVEPFNSQIGGVEVRWLRQARDARGWLVELFRSDELPLSVRPTMAYVSQTEPNVVRGPHEHVDQTDCFAFIGPGVFRLYLWDRRSKSPTVGLHEQLIAGESCPAAVLVPPGVVHAYKNFSDRPGWVFNAPDRLYAGPGRSSPVDEIRWEALPENPYVID